MEINVLLNNKDLKTILQIKKENIRKYHKTNPWIQSKKKSK